MRLKTCKKILSVFVVTLLCVALIPMSFMSVSAADPTYAIAVYTLRMGGPPGAPVPAFDVTVNVGGKSYTVAIDGWAAAVAVQIVEAINADPDATVKLYSNLRADNPNVPCAAEAGHVPAGALENRDILVRALQPGEAGNALVALTIVHTNPDYFITYEVEKPHLAVVGTGTAPAAAAPASPAPPTPPAETPAAPAAEAPAQPAPQQQAPPAPRTFDPVVLIAVAALISAAGIIIAKKRKTRSI